MQGGTIGVFVDKTSAQYPNIQDTSRDADFVDIDLDGDEDLFISNTSTDTDQSNRFQINQGGLQAGTAGFFVDETSTRWVNVGEIAGFSSVAATLALPTGGFIDWSCDCLFGDLDNDGDMDLVQTSYGPSFTGTVPSRFFLNDGAGFYEEFNPSGFQLPGQSIANGDPALWAEGVHQHNTMVFNGTQADIAGNTLGAELGDVDADFDLDLLIGARNEQPRLFINKLAENNGVLTTFRDATYGAFTDLCARQRQLRAGVRGSGQRQRPRHLRLELGAGGFNDSTMRNDGTGHYGPSTTLSGSTSDDNDGDWFDYDNDGYLDVFVANFSGQDRLYQNGGPPSYTLSNVTAAELPSETKTGLGGDTVDVDNDGDYEVMVTNNNYQADQLWINITQIPDANAPRVIAEQAPDQTGTSDPTPLRARVYDNASWDVIRYYDTVIEYTVNGGAAADRGDDRRRRPELLRGDPRRAGRRHRLHDPVDRPGLEHRCLEPALLHGRGHGQLLHRRHLGLGLRGALRARAACRAPRPLPGSCSPPRPSKARRTASSSSARTAVRRTRGATARASSASCRP